MKARLQGVLLLALLALLATPAGAQPTPGAICVATFADANADGVRDAGEEPLAGVNVNLSTGGAIIAAHVTSPDETQHCFENLSPGLYTVTFTEAPLYRFTTASEGTFALDAGQRLTINELGAVPVPPEAVRAALAAAAADDEPPDPSTRLLWSTAGALLVMLFLITLGAVILGLSAWRRARRRGVDLTPSLPHTRRKQKRFWTRRRRGDDKLLPPPPDIRPPGR